jgi:precorrin-3B synthase
MSVLASDRCPGVLRLHEAADGMLARIRLPGGRLPARGLRAVAELAQRGNGIIELTSRAGVQVRGLRAGEGPAAAEMLRRAGLLPSPAHDLARNILASPLAGRHPRARAEIDCLVEELDRLICADPELAALPGRFLFAVDDGSGVLGGPVATIGLVAESARRFRLTLSGRDSGRRASLTGAAALACEAARQLVGGGPALPGDAPAAERSTAPEPGALAQRDGHLALTALVPLGRLAPKQARALADCTEEVRLSPARTLSLVDRGEREVERLRGELTALGLVVDPASGWHGLSACAGLGACARALTDVRAEAERRARVRGVGAPREHWAACPRRCGRPAGAHVGYVATARGVLREEIA